MADIDAYIDAEFEKIVDVDCSSILGQNGLVSLLEGSIINFHSFFSGVFISDESFFPSSIYVRKEMCDVFQELTKPNRRFRQVLFGSPGVGKSILMFLVAISRTLRDDAQVFFIRKNRDSGEETSAFSLKKLDEKPGWIRVTSNREIPKEASISKIKTYLGKASLAKVNQQTRNNEIVVFLDGLHEGDEDIRGRHQYLSTSGGFTQPHGEELKTTSLVAMSGWQKEHLGLALLKIGALNPEFNKIERDVGEPDLEYEARAISEIYFHCGGRIREAIHFAMKDGPSTWKNEKIVSINGLGIESLKLSLRSTKSSSQKESPDRLRTLFRMPSSNPGTFGDVMQIVDSQYVVRQLQDRIGAEEHFNAYKAALQVGQPTVAGCHFEDFMHCLFCKHPKPIIESIRSTGTGQEGVSQLEKLFVYWIPSIPNFANIDAAVVVVDADDPSLATLWCFQYTIKETHAFKSSTFRSKFVRKVEAKLRAKYNELVSISVKVVFVVPSGVVAFAIPEDVSSDPDLEGSCISINCASLVTAQDSFVAFSFIKNPLEYQPVILHDAPVA